MTVARPKRPALRYHGGKWRLAPWIIQHLAPHRIYVEPYSGAISVLMRKSRSFQEVVNDVDGDVVNYFRVLRDPGQAEALKHSLELTPWARREFYDAYQPSTDPLERARRLCVRQFMGFGTTARRASRTGFRGRAYRENQTGVGDWLNLPRCLAAFTERLRGVVIEEGPAVALIERNDTPETMFYVDPPYPLSVRSSARCKGDEGIAYAAEMTDDDHRALAAVLRSVEGMVVLSGYPCDLYDTELYPDWQRFTKAALADGARPRTEVLWLNEAATTRLAQGVLDLA